MKARFFDRQDPNDGRSGVQVQNATDLARAFTAEADRMPYFVELVGENGYSLLIGIGPAGCAQFSATDGSGVAQMAVAPSSSPGPEFVEFLIGGTATPVPSRYCMPFSVVARIAGEFINTGGRSRDVSWEIV